MSLPWWKEARQDIFHFLYRLPWLFINQKKTLCQSILRTSNLHRIILTRRERKGKKTLLSNNYLSHFDICYWLEYNLSLKVRCLNVNKSIIWLNKCIQYIKSLTKLTNLISFSQCPYNMQTSPSRSFCALRYKRRYYNG